MHVIACLYVPYKIRHIALTKLLLLVMQNNITPQNDESIHKDVSSK